MNKENVTNEPNAPETGFEIAPAQYTTKLSDHFVVGRPGLTEKMRTGQEEATPQSEKNDNGYGADNKLVSRERYEELKKRMRQKFGGQLNMGIDPEILAIGTEMAAYHIEAGARKFADYARHMIDDLGDAIRPYLKSFYNGARDLPEVQEAGLSNEMTPYEEVRTFDVANFDKPTVNAIDTAQMVVQEQEADKQAESAKNALTERRNKQRKKEHQKKQKESKIADLFSGREGTSPKSQEVKSADTSTYNAENTGINRKFADAVKTDMLSALDSGTKPYRSILDLRKRAAGLGMEVDNDGRTDILLQEFVEDGLVRAAREVAERHGSDSRETYNLICKLYEMQPTIAARSSNRIKMQQYSTPLPMAWNAVRFAMTGKKDGKVLEPTAGNGMLVFAIPAGQVHANELDGTRLANLREQGFAQVTQQDATEPFEGGKQYDVVIANPPFGKREAVDYDGKLVSGLDPQITLNALASMKDDGKAAIIIGGNMEYAKNGAINNMKPFFTYLYDHYNVKGVVDMDGSLYAKQGTTYPTRMILIDGRRSDEERAQSAVYPPVQSKAIRKADSFEALYDIIDGVINSKDKTNGAEILRERRPLRPVAGRPRGNVDQRGREEESSEGNRPVERLRGGLDSRLEDVLGEQDGNDTRNRRELAGGRGRDRELGGHPDQRMGMEGRPSSVPAQQGGSGRTADTAGRGGERVRGGRERLLDTQLHPDGNTGDGSRSVLKNEPKRQLDTEKLPYRPHNSAFSLESVAPAAMVEAMDRTLSQIEKKHGNIDEFVRKELGYDTTDELHQALAAEQVDSVAMAIYQMKQRQALIIGDQTGVGKGRQMAALIRWAVRQGEKPIFITQKADLFSDIYRDLVDIGSGDLVPFIFNDPSGQENRGEMVDSGGKVVYKGLTKSKMQKVLATGKLPDEYDYAVLTYSQVNTGDETSRKEAKEAAKKNGKRGKKSKDDSKISPKAPFLREIAKDNYVFLDESHTAAGEGNTGAFMQSILRDVKAATFASATFAKRPDTMPLYAIRTAMSQAKVEPDKLISIIEKGGVTLQEIMSRELTNAGQMVRRERDMSDVVTDWETIDDPETVRRARENYDRTIAAFNAIIKFQDDYVTPMVETMDKELATMAGSAGLKKGTKKMGVDNVPFASKTYNYTKQLMLALKADAIADKVDSEIKAGRHPVIALESTMESSIDEYTAGEVVAEPTFATNLLKGLDSVMQYTVNDENGGKQNYSYSPKQLGAAGEKAYYELQEFIRESTKGIFISPIDAIIGRLREMGYKVGELTGRDKYVELDNEGRAIVRNRTDKDKKRMQREFNNGDLDVLILNKSASTGISLHASEKFSDQRQRTMIIAQPLSDINDYMQMIGRIDRTGQVHRGYYINLGLPVPAENRFLMMLSTKLKSLNANTTTSQDSESNEVEAPDLLNKYGSQVVVEYLRDNPDIYDKMGRPLKKNGEKGGTVSIAELDEYKPKEDDARKITGYVALLTTQEQEEFYDDVVRRYNELIKYLNDTGNNDLKITVMPLRAKTLTKRVSSEGIDPTGTNPFAQNSYVEQVEMDVLRKPMKAAEIRKTIEQVNKGKSPEDYIRQVVATIEKEDEARIAAEQARYERSKVRAQEDIAKQTEKINRQQKRTAEEKQAAIADYVKETNTNVEAKHNDNLARLNTNSDMLKRSLHMFEVGKSYLMPDNLETMVFDFTTPAIFCGYKAKDSKVTASTTLAVFATLDGRRRVEVKLSDIAALRSIYKATNDNWDAARSTTLENWDGQIPTGTRKTGYIMTGNILQAIADTQDERGGFPGQLISYTDIDGNVHDGILMPDKWNTSMLKTSGAPILSRLKQIKDYMPVTSHDGKVEITGSSWAKTYYLTIPKTKKDGAVFFENKVILRAVNGGNFYPYRGKLRADIPSENIETVVKELSKLGVKVQEEANDDDVLYREADDDLSKVNERFNEELQRYQDGQMNKNDMFHLGNPYGTMRMFLPDLPIVMRQRIMTKGSVKKHNIEPAALENMPQHLSEPIFVFQRTDNVLGVLTEMKDRDGKNVCVAISLSQTIQDGKDVLEVNDIRSIHGRNEADIIYPIVQNNTLVWADKEKGLAWLSSASQSVQQEIDKQDLVSAANIVRNFENPSVEEENLREESVSTDNESPDLFRRVIGGNSGYVGYSKSKRAVRAENAGLRNKSQMDAEFASEVNDIIASENPDQPKVTLKEIKQSLKNIKPDEWHHTSMYGNRTNYYSARTVADYFLERATQADEHEREQMLAQASERINRANDALYEHVQAHIPLESVDTQLGKRKAYKSSNGLYVEVNRSFKSGRVYAIGELAGESHLFVDRYSDWVYDSAENRERFEEAINEANDAQQTALDGAPQELKEEVQNAKDDYERIRESKNTDVSTREGNGALTDDDLSIENDPVSKFSDKSARTARQRREFAERERQRMVQRVQELAKKLHLDNVDIVTDASTLQGRRAKAKGFFSRRTGRITIVIPNHTSVFDVEQTLLHEAVAHYGLRQLFGEHFDTFLDNVLQNADPEVRRRIVELARRRGWDFRTATEEYLASLAERTNFENIDAGWWQKIKSLFLKMLHKMGFEDFSGVTLSDNELRYILWRSYENLAEPGRYRSILGEAEDVAKQYELKVGNFAPTAAIGGQVAESANSVKAERIRKLRESKPVEITGEEYRGKYELNRDSAQKYVLDNLRGEYTIKDTGEKVNLSKVGAKKVTSHSMGNEAHLKSIAAIPQLISNAIFIEERPPYKEGAQYDSYRYYVTGLKINGEDYTVRMTIGVKNGKYYYDHYLTNIEKGNLIEIAQGFIPTEDAPNPSYADYKDKVLLSILKENEEENLLYRQGTDENMDEGDGTSPLSGPTIQAWDKIANSTKFKLTETAFDYLNAVDKFQKLIAEHSGKPVKDFENAYDALTFLSSKNREEMDMFDSFFVKPLNEAIVALTGKADSRRNWKWDRGPLRELVMYVEAKHGTERNRQMSVEAVAREDKENASSIMQAWSEAKKRINGQDGLSWTEKQAQLDESAKSLGADVAQDYSGLSSVFGNTEQYPEGWNDAARAYVTQYEDSHGQDKTSALWHAINNATGFTLQKQYETGLVSREYVERQRERFENYIPLRGFENDTAGDVYNYIGQDYYPGGNPVKTAHGRTSEPGNPFGSILNTSYASISSGNKNVAKTAFYALVMNHDTGGLAVPRRAWKVRYADLKSNPELERTVASPKLDNDEEIPEWIEAVPRIPEKGTPEEIARVLGEFESVMNKYSEEGATEPIWKKSQIAYRTLYKERDQHEIPLYIAGDKYVITITGNPRVAQAVNGLLNPNSGNENKWLEFAKKVQRFMAGAFTAKNAAFSLANLSRDTIYANNQIFIREDTRYWLRFTKNQKAGFGDYPQIMRRLYKYRSGKLDMNDKTERLFAEFMRNGGATGYTFVNTQEEYAKELEKKLRQLSKGRPDWYTPNGAVKLAFDCIEFAGQSAELVNRFAAYRTSREMGRSVSRSIRDAKEITVNFNRKGAGRKTLSDKNAWYVNLAASTSEYGLDFMLFWNANMQGKYRFFQNLREHPVKTGVTMIGNSMLISAVMLPLLNNIVLPALYSMSGSGDDDGDKDRDDAANDYFNSLTDYERTRNICIRLPKGNWLKIPVSPDVAPWFTIGDAIGGQISGQRDIKASDVVHSTVDAVSPLSINWSYKGYARALNMLPTVTQPIAQNMMNVNFMGNPIRKAPFTTKQGKNPQYTMVYRNASPTLVELSRLSNRLTGGEDDKSSGEADWNPSMVQNLISGYTGGYGTTFLSLADWIVGTSKGEKQAVTFSKMPFVSRFAISGNKDVRLQRINSRFYEVRDFVMDFEFDRDRYLKRIAEGQKEHDSMKVAEGMTLYNDLIHSHRAAKYNRLARISGAVDAYEKYLKEFPDDEATRNLLYQIKSSGIDVLRENEEENPGARK